MFFERVLDGIPKPSVFTAAQFETIKAIDGDLVYIEIFHSEKNFWAVVKPGTYTMAEGETK